MRCRWKYTCVDSITPLLAKNSGMTEIKATRIYVYRDPESDIYVDEFVVIDREPTDDIGEPLFKIKLHHIYWLIQYRKRSIPAVKVYCIDIGSGPSFTRYVKVIL